MILNAERKKEREKERKILWFKNLKKNKENKKCHVSYDIFVLKKPLKLIAVTFGTMDTRFRFLAKSLGWIAQESRHLAE